ncbi:MAG: MoaD/ThiS family protein [Anaerolineales bacterium]|nr:MoaD/ThiS family protein [Anaerolineales bacterium]
MAEVKLFANLRQFTDKTAVTSPGTTVADVLHALFNQYPALAAAVLENNQPKPHVRIMVNGHAIELGDGLETAVTDTDTIAIFPPIAGG